MNIINDDILLKYNRQILIPSFGLEGQQRLFDSKIMIIGTGGLGCSNAIYLAGSGVGEIILVDNDLIELSNLPRQILFNKADIGKPKSVTASFKLAENYPDTKFSAINEFFSESLITKLKPNIIIDAGDNLILSLQLSEQAKIHNIPLIHASVTRQEGHVYVYLPERNFPPLAKIFPKNSAGETCSRNGVMTTAVGIVATIQAHQTIRTIHNSAEIKPELLLFDGKQMRFIPIAIKN